LTRSQVVKKSAGAVRQRVCLRKKGEQLESPKWVGGRGFFFVEGGAPKRLPLGKTGIKTLVPGNL